MPPVEAAVAVVQRCTPRDRRQPGELKTVSARNVFVSLTTALLLAACSRGVESPAAQADGKAVILEIKGMNCAA